MAISSLENVKIEAVKSCFMTTINPISQVGFIYATLLEQVHPAQEHTLKECKPAPEISFEDQVAGQMAKSHQRSASTQTHADKVGLDGIRGLFEHKQFYNSMVDWLEKKLWSPRLNSKEGKPSS